MSRSNNQAAHLRLLGLPNQSLSILLPPWGGHKVYERTGRPQLRQHGSIRADGADESRIKALLYLRLGAEHRRAGHG